MSGNRGHRNMLHQAILDVWSAPGKRRSGGGKWSLFGQKGGWRRHTACAGEGCLGCTEGWVRNGKRA